MYHFYSFPLEKKIIVSNLPLDTIKKKFGNRFERLSSVKELQAIPLTLERLKRTYPGFVAEEHYLKPRVAMSDEARKRISDSKLGKPRSPEVRAKISAALKGRSNFQGKSHTKETRARMAAKKLGNQHTRDTIWAHNPRGDEEVRIRTLRDIPTGFSKGRDYYSTEAGLYYFFKHLKQSRS